jgi:bacteriorhodopsin
MSVPEHPARAGTARRVTKWLLWAVVIAAAVVVLFLWVFPWVESLQQDPTMGTDADALAVVHDARSPR